uniref:Uncharacterized protein n=1 Tax=Scophthalmus maximus TaxID=52904 RepID=A0A8D3A3J7_SCOMX
MSGRWFIKPLGTKTCKKTGSQINCNVCPVVAFGFKGVRNSSLPSLTLRSILAKPRALDARSLASWNSSLSDRLKCEPSFPPYLISSEAVLSSALSQNSLPLFCKPASRNSPVDLSSIPAMSLFPDWASPPRM